MIILFILLPFISEEVEPSKIWFWVAMEILWIDVPLLAFAPWFISFLLNN